MTRYWDRMLRRDQGFWEGMASGAAVLTTTYGQPDHEAVLPTLTRATHDAYGSNSPVFAAILVRLKLFSEARFCWQALDDKHLFGDTSLSVLEHPFGPGTNSGELLVRMQQDASLAGNAYIWAPPGEGRLVRKRPDWVTIISRLVSTADGGWYREKTGYWWEPPKDARGQGEGHLMDAGDVCHWAPIPDPLADFRGMSWLSPVLRDIQGDNGMAAYKLQYLQHAATPNLLLKYAQKLAPGTVDRIRERVTARYGGVNNAFKTIVLDQGADATVVGANMQQLDFTNVTSAGVERILADSMVPPVLVGLEPLRGAGRGYQESLQKLANLWARPEWRSACGALEQIAPPPTPGVRLWFDDDDIAALQDGEMEKGQTALVRAQAVLTHVQAGATLESSMAAVDAGDVTLLKAAPVPVPAPPVQHLLPQPGQPGATANPLPPTGPRLDTGPVSPGPGGQNTRPLPKQLAAGRRSITAGANGDGDRPFVSRVGPHGYIHGWIHVGGSIDEHSPGGKLTPARQALHDRIIAGALAGTSPSAHPTATFMGGGPASGKSELLKQRPASGVVIDPDAIKKQLPEYQKMLDAGDKSAAAYVHEESSKIAKDIMAAAVAGGRDFTLDGVGDGDYAKLAAKIEAARRAGYLVHGRYITVDTNTAAARAAKRGARTGRVVPETYLREAHAGVSAAFRQAVEHNAFDTAELWDNNTTKELSAVGIKLIGSKKTGGTFKVIDPAAWARFLAKEHEQWNAAKQHT